MPRSDRCSVSRPSREEPGDGGCRQAARLTLRPVARQAVLLEYGQDLRFENLTRLGESRSSDAEE